MKQKEWAKALADKVMEWHSTKSIPTASEICQKLFDFMTKKGESE